MCFREMYKGIRVPCVQIQVSLLWILFSMVKQIRNERFEDMSFITNWDISILQFINDHMHMAILDKIMPIITKLGDVGIVWFAISIALIISKKYRRIGWVCILSLFISSLIGEIFLKHTIQRTRPFNVVAGIDLLVRKPITSSFPSGHTTASFAVAYVISKTIKDFKPYVIVLAILIAFSRLYLFVHYPTDVLAGIVIGLLSGMAAVRFAVKKRYIKC